MLALAAPVVANGAVGDHTVPEIPDKPSRSQFREAPRAWRHFLVEARAAEQIKDPLQRCLAYPDLPLNDWPDGHAEAHCRNHVVSPMSMDELAGFIDGRRLDVLHERLDAALERHFAEDDFGEDIHYMLDGFGDVGGEGDRLTARWLELAPDSAYAYHARGVFLLGAAGKARGTRSAALTPPADMRRMSKLVALAVVRLQKALAIEPRLLPAHAMLIHAAMLDSRDELQERAIEDARAIDPACLDVAKRRMTALKPRWGGSYAEMESFSKALEPLTGRRPGLAVVLGAPWADRASVLRADDVYTDETADLLDIAVKLGSDEDHLADAADVALYREDGADQWQALAYLLQANRFREGTAWAERTLARLLVRSEPEMSLVHGYRALEKAKPEDLPQVHYLIGAGHYNVGNHVEAEEHYLLAAADPDTLPDALGELAEMWLFHDPSDPRAGADKAEPYIDRLLAAVPTSGIGRLLRLEQRAAQGKPLDAEVFRQFIEHADRNDRRQREALGKVEPLLEVLEQAMEQGPPVD